jgi:predicted Rdx family selenoprotein
VLPAAPLGEVIERGFRPVVTTLGDRHPVTADLTGAGKPAPMGVANAQREDPSWGRWFRQIATRADRGHTLMAGADDRPLIVLDRAGEGRVAQILSDHLWLWNRGVDGGGPQAELVRRIAHWLMKEPDLEEEALRATVQGARIELRRNTMAEGFRPVTMTGPDGKTQTLTLNPIAPGRAIAGIGVDKPGVYRFDDGEKSAVAAVGNPDPLEFADVRASPDKLKPLVEASGGAMIWLGETADPDVRAVQPGRSMGGSDWLGVRRNGGYTVTGVDRYPLLPGIAIALLFLFAIGFAWWREGK